MAQFKPGRLNCRCANESRLLNASFRKFRYLKNSRGNKDRMTPRVKTKRGRRDCPKSKAAR